MSRTVFRAVSPRFLLRAIEVSAWGLDQVYALGLRRRHPWHRVGVVRWVAHGHAVVCCDGGDVELAGIEDVAGAVAAIEAQLLEELQGDFEWREADLLGRRWRSGSQSSAELARPKVIVRALLGLACAGLAALMSDGRSGAEGWLALGAVVLMLLTGHAVITVPGVKPAPRLIGAHGIRIDGAQIPWGCIRSWTIEPSYSGLVRLRMETPLGSRTSLDLTEDQGRDLCDLLTRLPKQLTSPLRFAGPEPIRNTALSVVRMPGDPAQDRGLSLAADDHVEG